MTSIAPNRKFSAQERALGKASRALRGGDDASVVHRLATCQGTCHRDDAQLAAAGVKRLSALVAHRDYGRTILCWDCLMGGAKPVGYWPSVHGHGQGQFDWRVEVRPFGAPDAQEAVAVELWCARGWTPINLGDGSLAWRRAEPSLKWLQVFNTLEFAGMHGKVTIAVRRKGTRDWTPGASYIFRGAEHTSEVFQACKRLV